ncbi:shieldin complex subunit 3 [Myripristis murdjan]|uniref:Zgc:101664 n=1 Tax=Myripristis murdjan TaxID=586833 RepID=A0A667X566_9TELE|nr:shieldin complex subunit 3 [Myripristis murdjan]XP_029915408.1 shieldin complex subunit 3 [Myripristis murdjan]
MEDVVLHHRPDSASGLRCLLDTTQKLLEPFPRRTPPTFTPWFPPSADRRLPIRPGRAAPVITAAIIQETAAEAQTPRGSSVCERAAAPVGWTPQTAGRDDRLACERRPEPAATKPPEEDEEPELRDVHLVTDRPARPDPQAETLKKPNRPAPAAALSGRAASAKSSPEKQPQKDGGDAGGRRSWSVLAQKGTAAWSSVSLSSHFLGTVCKHRLHLHQRAKWVISQHNCGASRDIEQVWRAVSRAIRSCRLPTCNGNIQRSQAEIWLFCDLLYSELVGTFLKDELRLAGSISLSVHKLGNIFSL